MRSILAVLAGYLVMFVWVATTLSIAWYFTGPEVGFRPDTTEVTVIWLLINIPLSFIGAIFGGWVAAVIGRHRSNLPVKVLAGVVFLLALLNAWMQRTMERPEIPEGFDLSTFEAAQYAIQPDWYNFFLAILGPAGVLLGGMMHQRLRQAVGEPSQPAHHPPGDS
jgi:hypothetical protein